MSKTWLMIIGVVILLMGIAALVPSWTMATEPAWHSWTKIVIGVLAIGISASDKK